MITQIQLKAALEYNPETGLFTWLRPHQKVRVGDIAGTKTKGYILITVDGTMYRAHRLACLYMKGRWPKHQMDHKDRVRDNNKWLNLREATNQENQKNSNIRSDNKSGVNGVCWHKKHERWRVKISYECKSIYLGYFIDKFEAICARMSANNKYGYYENHGR